MSFQRPHLYAVVCILLIVAALAVSLASGTPDALPDVALDSALLLHVERTLVVVLGAWLVFVIAARAWKGELPTEMSRDGFKYAPIDPETIEEAKGAAELAGGREKSKDDPEEGPPETLLALRLKLEAKLAYIAKILLRPDDSPATSFVTIGSLNYDGYLTDQEAGVASQVMTLRDEELDTLPPRVRREFLQSADTVVRNIRASVFFGLVRTSLEKNGWQVEEIANPDRRRSDLLVRKGDQCFRVVPRFSIAENAELLSRMKRRLVNHPEEAPGKQRDIVVLPDRTRNQLEPSAKQAIVKFEDLRRMLGLETDPRTLP